MLADLLAGEGSERDVDTVADSPELSAALVDLEAAQAAVAADLARLPRPDVPAGLEDRIAAALLAAGPYEPLSRVPVAGGALRALDDPADREGAPVSHVTGHPPGSVVPLRRGHQVPSRNPWPLRAAAAVALVTVGGLGFALLPRGGGTDQASSTEAGSAADAAPGLPAVPTNNSGIDYAASPGLLEEAVPTLLGGAAAAQGAMTGQDRSAKDGAQKFGSASDPSSAPVLPAPARSSTADPDPVLDRLRSPDELAGCLSALAPPDVQLVPAALDYAAWDGKPALVILVPMPATGSGYDVFVVGADCQAGEDDTLHFERVPA